MSQSNLAPYDNNVTDPLHSLSPELSQRLKDLLDRALLGFIRPNSMSQFAQHAPELANFREAMAQGNPDDDVEFLRRFREFIPTTDYEPYRSYIAKFFATPCKKSDVENLLAPGLPYCLVVSSATSGKASKAFPVYRPAPHLLRPPPHLSLRHSEGNTFSLSSLSVGQALKMDLEDGQTSKILPVCPITAGFLRMEMDWDVEHDMDRLDLWVPGKADPYAISLVKDYRSFFILNALFALSVRRVTTIRFVYASVFVNLLQYIEDEWTLLIDCIAKGNIPEMDKIDHVREPLEKHFTPNPIRAAELREIGPPVIQGWAVRVWPDLKNFIGITGGPAAASVPKVTHILGPSVTMQAFSYGSSECYHIAFPYFNGNPNTDFKITPIHGVTEYLDVRCKEPSERVLSAWELETGGHYEVVLTTRNGLWRYRLGDVVAIKGFAPDDGLPVINYLHRRDASLGLACGSTCTESQLTNAIVSASERWIGQIIGFTVVADDRDTPVTYGYLVEIEGEIGKDAKMATQYIFEELMANNDYHMAFWQGRGRKPTIRLVEKGTFTEYRSQKCNKTNVSMSQVKVPTVLSDPSFREWILQKVIMEL
ncbi:GH3 auxin-responsive promoter [Suillus bovinus]|uniref:GH3 auxin-responsive promoter n=1 Tax=Suillus bovinus TaxID=48563 RepID=UPI001B886C93|nr:GH3 auxin-responsive promoter [Suillus bovinus]KAG2152671.1 GH3 auxin-responsive promoter [Suillus bovinus]